MSRISPLRKYDPEWLGPLCLKDGTEVHMDFRHPMSSDVRGAFVKDGRSYFGYWDKAGNSLSPAGESLYCATINLSGKSS